MSYIYTDQSLLNDIYATPRTNDDINVIEHVSIEIGEVIGEDVQRLFVNDESIIKFFNSNSKVQMIELSTYFKRMILIFRAIVDVDLTEPYVYLSEDCDAMDWLYLFKLHVLPTLGRHNVLRTIYKIRSDNEIQK
jgi:hypothetical protein